MKLKDAFVRACRTAGQVFVTTLVIARPAADIVGVRHAAIAQATSLAGAALFAVTTGLVAFVQNATEDNTSVQLPK